MVYNYAFKNKTKHFTIISQILKKMIIYFAIKINKMRINKMRGIWQMWARINFPIWLGYEIGGHRNEKGLIAGIKPAMKGVFKGTIASLIPPMGIYYAYEVYKNWETYELD